MDYVQALQTGTSVAAPHVSGAAAVILSFVPDLWPFDVEHVLTRSTVVTLDPLRDGWGRLNLGAAMDSLIIPNLNVQLLEPLSKVVEDDRPGDKYVKITWDAYLEILPFHQYNIWRKVDSGSWIKKWEVELHEQRLINDQNVSPGHTYYYRVDAFRSEYRDIPFAQYIPPGQPTVFYQGVVGRSMVESVTYSGGGGPPEPSPPLEEALPDELDLKPNYPNPFNPTTQIKFGLPAAAHVLLQIMNIRGQTVRLLVDDIKTAGWHTVTWDGKNESGHDVASGIYLYMIEADNKKILKRMTIIR